MTETQISCGYNHDYWDEDMTCDLCDRRITPSCSGMRVRTGHLESPEGENAFAVCLDCAGQRQGFVESIAMLAAEVSDRWEAKKQPGLEYRAALQEAAAAFKASTAEQQVICRAAMAEAAMAYKQTGAEPGSFDFAVTVNLDPCK